MKESRHTLLLVWVCEDKENCPFEDIWENIFIYLLLFELFLESKKTSNYGIAALLFVALFLTQYLFSRIGGIVSRSDDNAQYEQRDLRRRLLSLYVIAN